jgi:hypothetical protein
MKKFTMNDTQLAGLMEAMQPRPMIMLQCGNPPSLQERANAAWQALGAEMGFKHMTVRPDGPDPKNFVAEEVVLC